MPALRPLLVAALLCLLAGCATPPSPAPSVTVRPFGVMPAEHPDAGQTVELHTLVNRHGLRVSVMNYGAAVVSIETPDRHGRLADITLGYDRFADHLGKNPYYGATIGRYAGRISNARLTLGDETSELAANDGPHSLHGGPLGFDKRHWTTEPVAENPDDQSASVRFSLVSPAGDQGFPGTLRATVTYTLTDANELILHYAATTDAPTVVNLTNHIYFNLAGDPDESGRQLLTLHSDRYLEQGRGWVPTGRILPVADTEMDFRQPVRLDDRVRTPRTNPNWFDHSYVLDGQPDPRSGLRPAAELHDPVSGRRLRIATDQPTLYFYPGNSLLDLPPGKGGRIYSRFAGVCLEPQSWPDAPNRPEFSHHNLYPEEKYESTTILGFHHPPRLLDEHASPAH